MAVASVTRMDTTVNVSPERNKSPVSRPDARQKVHSLEVVQPTADDTSSSESANLPASSSNGGDMRIVKSPESVGGSFSGWSEINQAWEGRVVENNPGEREFVAVISDRTDPSNPDEEVVIGYESVINSDIELIAEGAVFFWSIGKYRNFLTASGKVGPAVNKYELRFRRLPPISKETIEEIKVLSKGLYNRIHGH